jgi:hypothetical protein
MLKEISISFNTSKGGIQMTDKTREILDFFREISSIPRCSKNEQNISRWLQQWAETRSFEVQNDAAGNLKINIGASHGYESAPAIVFQGHMDMVCEKSPDSNHDFSKDPIQLVYDGDWLHADRTTLGADNGIAMAIGMALASDPSLKHPPLELLFTVNEETGLNGAKQLEPGFIEGRILLNVDSAERHGTIQAHGSGTEWRAFGCRHSSTTGQCQQNSGPSPASVKCQLPDTIGHLSGRHGTQCHPQRRRRHAGMPAQADHCNPANRFRIQTHRSKRICAHRKKHVPFTGAN